ncbi:uncharacterized protein LOC132043134 [Lycium ferocissimum]|uniref:uncharacterized protein LOC132043134 n=1 Tax=Lycium ferocissimum TaxID=112874 RepID=UPI00281580BC|nr:uncharacterized protein LOC132043134 [Lycium ferocissimum]
MDNLWSQFIKAKYSPRANMVSNVISPNNSNIWRSLLKIRPQAKHHIQWEINKGNTLFWWDNWITQGPLAPRVWLERKPGSITVQNFINNNQWNTASLSRILPNEMIQEVTNTRIGDNEIADTCIWTPSTNGNFSCSSAWELIPEKVDHVFATSPFADTLWKQMAKPLGIHQQSNSVQGALDQASGEFSQRIKFTSIFFLSPRVTFYGNYGEQDVTKGIASISKRFNKIDNNWDWKTIIKKAENYGKELPRQWYIRTDRRDDWKLNTDGSTMEGIRASGIGGIVRKGNGRMIIAFAKHIEFTTNNSCELQAAMHGIKWYKEQQQQPRLILEMDSLVIVNMLRGQTTAPWRLRKSIEEARNIIQQNISKSSTASWKQCRSRHLGKKSRYKQVRKKDLHQGR